MQQKPPCVWLLGCNRQSRPTAASLGAPPATLCRYPGTVDCGSVTARPLAAGSGLTAGDAHLTLPRPPETGISRSPRSATDSCSNQAACPLTAGRPGLRERSPGIRGRLSSRGRAAAAAGGGGAELPGGPDAPHPGDAAAGGGLHRGPLQQHGLLGGRDRPVGAGRRRVQLGWLPSCSDGACIPAVTCIHLTGQLVHDPLLEACAQRVDPRPAGAQTPVRQASRQRVMEALASQGEHRDCFFRPHCAHLRQLFVVVLAPRSPVLTRPDNCCRQTSGRCGASATRRR